MLDAPHKMANCVERASWCVILKIHRKVNLNVVVMFTRCARPHARNPVRYCCFLLLCEYMCDTQTVTISGESFFDHISFNPRICIWCRIIVSIFDAHYQGHNHPSVEQILVYAPINVGEQRQTDSEKESTKGNKSYFIHLFRLPAPKLLSHIKSGATAVDIDWSKECAMWWWRWGWCTINHCSDLARNRIVRLIGSDSATFQTSR